MFWDVFFALLAIKLLTWLLAIFVGYFDRKFKEWRKERRAVQNEPRPFSFEHSREEEKKRYINRVKIWDNKNGRFIVWLRKNWRY